MKLLAGGGCRLQRAVTIEHPRSSRAEVQAWLARYHNPMKEGVLRIREIISKADHRIEERIKWQAFVGGTGYSP